MKLGVCKVIRGIQLSDFVVVVGGVSNPDLRYTAAEIGVRNPSNKSTFRQLNASGKVIDICIIIVYNME